MTEQEPARAPFAHLPRWGRYGLLAFLFIEMLQGLNDLIKGHGDEAEDQDGGDDHIQLEEMCGANDRMDPYHGGGLPCFHAFGPPRNDFHGRMCNRIFAYNFRKDWKCDESIV